MGLTPSASPPSWGLRLPSRRVQAHPAPSSGRRQLPAGRAGRGRTPCRRQVRSQGRLGRLRRGRQPPGGANNSSPAGQRPPQPVPGPSPPARQPAACAVTDANPAHAGARRRPSAPRKLMRTGEPLTFPCVASMKPLRFPQSGSALFHRRRLLVRQAGWPASRCCGDQPRFPPRAGIVSQA